MVEAFLASKMKQQTQNKTNFRFQPGGEGGPDPFAKSQKNTIKKRSLSKQAFVYHQEIGMLILFDQHVYSQSY